MLYLSMQEILSGHSNPVIERVVHAQIVHMSMHIDKNLSLYYFSFLLASKCCAKAHAITATTNFLRLHITSHHCPPVAFNSQYQLFTFAVT